MGPARDIPQPKRIAQLPTQPGSGLPVPWFVEWIDGLPDFRYASSARLAQAVKEQRCWVCGGILIGVPAFVLGPMCGVNRTSAEPPCHPACARYSAQVCPFLVKPAKVRREGHRHPDEVAPAGLAIQRNPGVALVWLSKSWSLFPDDGGKALFNIGEPHTVEWYCQGRLATRSEVMASIDSGLPILQEMAAEEGPEALDALRYLVRQLMPLLPRD